MILSKPKRSSSPQTDQMLIVDTDWPVLIKRGVMKFVVNKAHKQNSNRRKLAQHLFDPKIPHHRVLNATVVCCREIRFEINHLSSKLFTPAVIYQGDRCNSGHSIRPRRLVVRTSLGAVFTIPLLNELKINHDRALIETRAYVHVNDCTDQCRIDMAGQYADDRNITSSACMH